MIHLDLPDEAIAVAVVLHDEERSLTCAVRELEVKGAFKVPVPRENVAEVLRLAADLLTEVGEENTI